MLNFGCAESLLFLIYFICYSLKLYNCLFF
uniref:Uncharacterized protein n=1 Tax=Arundo donax TaxID=35708 RepID=A0A0A8YIS5_ARUDO